MDFVANLLGESEQEVATVDGEDLDGDWLEQIPSLVDLVYVFIDELETPGDKSRAALTRFRTNDSTVFDLISGLFAYVILGKNFFFFFFF